MNDDNSDDRDEGREALPSVSRMGRGGPRRYRTATRHRAHGRFPRHKRLLPIADLLGLLIKQHGLTDECRQQCVCLYWDEIAGVRLAPKTWPVRLAEGTLHIETDSSSWVHELQFHKAAIVARINAWVDANRVWLGPPPLVADIRFELGMRKKRTVIVDREHARRIQERQLRRLWRPRPNVPTAASDTEREAILAETITIIDPELRRVVESVRTKWNR